jgi:Fic family protein
MAGWREASWEPTVDSGVPRRDRRWGTYRTYYPDLLVGRAFVIDRNLALLVAEAERGVRDLSTSPGSEALARVARFLLRSEAIASSRIEGITPSPQQVALAELAHEESVRGVSEQAQLVANNITVVGTATNELVKTKLVTTEHVVELHRALLPDDTHQGLRKVQNWIGGSDWHPIEAAYVPPKHEEVPDLMSDLVDYMNGAAHSPVVQAAIVHAQFETIHPFADGNGRVGRALIHTVLARRGLTSAALLPDSLVLATLRNRYVDGLSSYRYDGEPQSKYERASVRAWLETFTEATVVAADNARMLMQQIVALQDDWRAQLASHRAQAGIRARPRANSAVARLLDILPEAPIVTARTAQRILRVSFPAANSAVEELAAAGILHPRRIQRATTAYIATEILDLITTTERRLASTRFDTRTSPPNRPVPSSPERRTVEVD